MAQALKKPKIEKDRFTADGVRLFNASKEHGVVYCDGYLETKYIQEYEGREVHYRGDGAPVGYKEGEPLPPAIDEVQAENDALKKRISDLEAAQNETLAILRELKAGASKAAPAPAAAAEGAPAPEASANAGSARKK